MRAFLKKYIKTCILAGFAMGMFFFLWIGSAIWMAFECYWITDAVSGVLLLAMPVAALALVVRMFKRRAAKLSETLSWKQYAALCGIVILLGFALFLLIIIVVRVICAYTICKEKGMWQL